MRKINFNRGWQFTRLESGETIPVTLPHDATISEPRDPDIRIGYLCAFYHGGKYEYKKVFSLPEEWEGKAVYLEFEGIYRNSEVFVNGEKISSLVNGYIGICKRIDGYLRTGNNEIKVCIDTPYNDHSRWYAGSGIYRDVFVYVGEKQDHIPPHGIRITPLSHSPAVIFAETQCREKCEIKYTVLDGENIVAESIGNGVKIEIPQAKLWSAEQPYLYILKTELFCDGSKKDEAYTRFGVRTLNWSAEEGLLVNGERTLLRGGCIHADNGPLGMFTTRQTEFRRAKKIKAAGFNAIRSAHHPMSPALLEACDEVGLYVMDEAFDMWYRMKTLNDFSSAFYGEYPLVLSEMVKKDYNHPSVILYSIGNEIPEIGSKKGIRYGKDMIRIVKESDITRPVLLCPSMRLAKDFLYGMPYDTVEEDEYLQDPENKKKDFEHYVKVWTRGLANILSVEDYTQERKEQDERATRALYDALDIAGYNYYGEYYEALHEVHPERVILGTETEGNKLSYHYAKMKKYPYVIGDFVWTLQDHLGECNCCELRYGEDSPKKDYPWISNWCGKLDLIGQENITAHRYRMVWGLEKGIKAAAQVPLHEGIEAKFNNDRETDAVMSWSFEGLEGKKTYVDVVTDAPYAEVLINGKSIGKKRTEDLRARFFCTYEPGTLIARGLDTEDNLLYEEKMTTAGKDTKLSVKADRLKLKADGQDVCFLEISVTDSAGIVKAYPDRKIRVTVGGAGRLAALGSAAFQTEESYTDSDHITFCGKALAVVCAGEKSGKITVRIESEDLEPVILETEAEK